MRSVAVVVALVALVAASPNTSDSFNDLVDEILREVEAAAAARGEEVVRLPDLDHPFYLRFLGLNLYGHLVIKAPRVGNISSIRRVGDAVVQDSAESLRVGLSLRAESLRLSAQELQFDFVELVRVDDALSVAVGENGVAVEVRLDFNGSSCTASLVRAELTALGGFSVSVLPPGLLNDAEGRLVSLAMDAAAGPLRRRLNDALLPLARRQLAHLHLCRRRLPRTHAPPHQ